jgi:uncharacterized protein
MEDNRYAIPKTRTATTVDVGLRAHMQSVYNRMTLGVLVTALTAWMVASSPALLGFFLGGPQAYIVMLAPLAVVWFGFNPARMNSNQMAISFFVLSVLYGISFSVIGLVFAKESIAQAFFIAAAMFAGLSIFGYTTRKNLDALGAFCVMGIWGILIASLVNLFIGSTGMQNVVAGFGIIAFSGITAWYTQLTKEMYNPAVGAEGNSRMAWMAALNLYISFIALFQYILHFLGNRQ